MGNLSESILASLQWRQRPFFQIESRDVSVSVSRASASDVMLDTAQVFPAGVWTNGMFLWVSDSSGHTIYAYELETGLRDNSVEFAVEAATGGIWSDGHTMWTVTVVTLSLSAYSLSTRARTDGNDIPLASGNRNPRDIWGDESTIWVSDFIDDHLYAYDISARRYNASKDIPLEDEPSGLYGDETHIWTAVAGSQQVKAYNRASKRRAPEFDWELNSADINPRAIVFFDDSIRLAYRSDDSAVRGYSYNETVTVTTEDPVFSIYLFHPDIDPLLATWDPTANTLAVTAAVADVLNDPPLVGNRGAAGTFFEQRLVIGGGEKFPQSIVGSRTPSPETGRPRFSDWEQIDNTLDVPTVFASHAFSYTMFSDIAIRIRWLANYAETVFIGCDHALYIARELAPDTPPIIRLHSIIGTASVQPAVAPFGIIYVSVDRSRVYEAFSKRDLTAHAEHLFESDPIKELAWSQNPVQRLWVLTESGKLFVLTISQENGVLAWSRIEFGRSVVVKSVAVGNGTDAGDTLWLAAERDGTVNLEALREPQDGEQMDRCYLDSSAVAQTSATGGVAGLSHLADVADVVVAGIADQRDERQETEVAGTAVSAAGALDTDFDGEAVRVGLPYTASLELPTLSQLPGGEGSAFGQPQRVAKATVGRYRSYGGRIGQHRDRMRDVTPSDAGDDLQG